MGHDLRKSQQHRIRDNQRHFFQCQSERPVSGNYLLLSGICQCPGNRRQVFHSEDLHRRSETVHNIIREDRPVGTPCPEVRIHTQRLWKWQDTKLQLLLRHRTLRIPLGGISADQEPYGRLRIHKQLEIRPEHRQQISSGRQRQQLRYGLWQRQLLPRPPVPERIQEV